MKSKDRQDLQKASYLPKNKDSFTSGQEALKELLQVARELRKCNQNVPPESLRSRGKQIQKIAQTLEIALVTDPLTGCLTQQAYKEHLRKLPPEMKRKNIKKYAIALIDFDDFGKINKAYGEAAGDKALQEAAKIIQKYVDEFNRKNKTMLELYRRGGDEFAILAVPAPKKKAFAKLVREIKGRVKSEQIPITVRKSKVIMINISFSAGIYVGSLPQKEQINWNDLEAIASKRLSDDKKRK